MDNFQVQRLLLGAGAYGGPIDGQIGPRTRAAAATLVDRYIGMIDGGTVGWNDYRRLIAATQIALSNDGFPVGRIDGIAGQKTIAALARWQDGNSAPAAEPEMYSDHSGVFIHPLFDAQSAARLRQAHPLIQRLMNKARDLIAFTVMDSQRGREEQERAYREGHSKAHFGQSAHNWTPAIAVDIAPVPLNWSDIGSFKHLQDVVGWWNPADNSGRGLAKAMQIPIRWGGDWNMNGKADEHLVDMPHYELHPWRDFAAKSKPYQG